MSESESACGMCAAPIKDAVIDTCPRCGEAAVLMLRTLRTIQDIIDDYTAVMAKLYPDFKEDATQDATENERNNG